MKCTVSDNKSKMKKKYRRRRITALFVLVIIISTILCFIAKCSFVEDEQEVYVPNVSSTAQTTPEITDEEIPKTSAMNLVFNEKTVNFDDELVVSKYAILVDAQSREVIAERNGNTRIYPASMTKVMTLIVAVENTKDFDDKFTMTYEIIKPLIDADATRAGFKEGEEISINDLLYGMILPSGADCSIALSEYISGSEEEFVNLMNEKCKELGLTHTHFSNTSGLHSEENYTTPAEMAIIMQYAMQNDMCRKVLSTYTYTTAKTPQNPEGIELFSTMFSRMYGNEVEGVQIVSGKTGYTIEAGNCLVSCAEKDGKSYIAVVADSGSGWKSIYDTFAVYENYLPKTTAVSSDTSSVSV